MIFNKVFKSKHKKKDIDNTLKYRKYFVSMGVNPIGYNMFFIALYDDVSMADNPEYSGFVGNLSKVRLEFIKMLKKQSLLDKLSTVQISFMFGGSEAEREVWEKYFKIPRVVVRIKIDE